MSFIDSHCRQECQVADSVTSTTSNLSTTFTSARWICPPVFSTSEFATGENSPKTSFRWRWNADCSWWVTWPSRCFSSWICLQQGPDHVWQKCWEQPSGCGRGGWPSSGLSQQAHPLAKCRNPSRSRGGKDSIEGESAGGVADCLPPDNDSSKSSCRGGIRTWKTRASSSSATEDRSCWIQWATLHVLYSSLLTSVINVRMNSFHIYLCAW